MALSPAFSNVELRYVWRMTLLSSSCYDLGQGISFSGSQRYPIVTRGVRKIRDSIQTDLALWTLGSVTVSSQGMSPSPRDANHCPPLTSF